MRRGFTASFRQDGGSGAVGGKGKAITVSQLTRRIKTMLEGEFATVLIEGEIGSITTPPSGHLYITLKDSNSVIDVVIWRSTVSKMASVPVQGDKVEVKGSITLYEPRGRYQLVGTRITPAGEGELRAEFEVMVNRLREEGLFDPEHKKELPTTPKVLGIVTSASGAAVRDIIKVAKKRMPSINIVLSPCVVQGEDAPVAIVDALSRLERWGGCDTILIGRGGGSLEDLAAFNDESVVRSVFACRTPIISAVGHEVDVSICDLVADVRAATPSEGAEIAVPEIIESRRRVQFLTQRLSNALQSKLETSKSRVSFLARRRGWNVPEGLLGQNLQRVDYLSEKVLDIGDDIVSDKKAKLALLSARLEGLSPLGILGRGYSVTRSEENKLLKSSQQVKIGDKIKTNLSEGVIFSEVVDIEE